MYRYVRIIFTNKIFYGFDKRNFFDPWILFFYFLITKPVRTYVCMFVLFSVWSQFSSIVQNTLGYVRITNKLNILISKDSNGDWFFSNQYGTVYINSIRRLNLQKFFFFKVKSSFILRQIVRCLNTSNWTQQI